jgi:hypothetical protein
MKTKWAICPECHGWNEVPTEFHELKHFCVCSCGATMFLIHTDPKEAAYRDFDKTTIALKKQ